VGNYYSILIIYNFQGARRSKRRKAPSRYFQNYENIIKVILITHSEINLSIDGKALTSKEDQKDYK
jgi:hypothetical protein